MFMYDLMQLLAFSFQKRALSCPDRQAAVFRIDPAVSGGQAGVQDMSVRGPQIVTPLARNSRG